LSVRDVTLSGVELFSYIIDKQLFKDSCEFRFKHGENNVVVDIFIEH